MTKDVLTVSLFGAVGGKKTGTNENAIRWISKNGYGSVYDEVMKGFE